MTKRNVLKFFQRKKDSDTVSLDDPIFDDANDDPTTTTSSRGDTSNNGMTASINSTDDGSNSNNQPQQEEENEATTPTPWYKRCKCTKQQQQHPPQPKKSLGEKWNAFTKKYRILILIFTIIIIWPFGIYCLSKFTNSTDSTFKPSDDSPSGQAVNVYHRAYVEENGNSGGDLPIGDPMNPPVVIVLDAIEKTSSSSSVSTPPWLSAHAFKDDEAHLNSHPRHPNLIDGWSDMYHSAKSFALNLESYLLSHPPFLEASQTSPHTKQKPLITVSSYYSLQNASLPVLAHAMATPHGRTTTIVLSYSIPAKYMSKTRTSHKYEADILSSLQTYGTLHQKQQSYYYRIKYTGLKFFQNDMREAIQSDMKRIHIFVTPISLLILIIVLGCNFYVALIPLLSVASTVFLWSIVMYFVAVYWMQITQFTPTIMMTLTVGLGIDYTLFLLSRFLSFRMEEEEEEEEGEEECGDDEAGEEGESGEKQSAAAATLMGQEEEQEECIGEVDTHYSSSSSTTSVPLSSPDDNENKAINAEDVVATNEEENQNPNENDADNNNNNENNNQQQHHYNNEAIQIMITAAGHTILISGITLMCCFLGLLFLPLIFFQSMAVGCSVTIVSTLIVNLTVVPALLHTRLGVKMRVWAMKRKGRQMGIAGAGEDIGRFMAWVYVKGGECCSRCCQKCRRGSDSNQEDGSEEEETENCDDGMQKESTMSRASTVATITNSSSSESSTNVVDDHSTDLLEPLLPASSSSPLLSSDESDARPSSSVTSAAIDTNEEETTTTTSATNNDDANNIDDTATTKHKSFWYELAEHLLNTKHSIIILTIVLAVMIPIACFAGQITSSISFELVLPQKTSLALRAYHLLGDRFGVGVLCPYRILIDGSEADASSAAAALTLGDDLGLNNGKKVRGKNVHTLEAFEVMYKLVHNLLVNEERMNKNKTTSVTCAHTIPSTSNATANQSTSTMDYYYTEFQESVMEMTKLIQDHQDDVVMAMSATASSAVISGDEQNIMEGYDSFEKQWEPLFRKLAAMERSQEKENSGQKPFFMQKYELTPTSSSIQSSSLTVNVTRYSGIAIADNIQIPHFVFEVAIFCDAVYHGHCPVKLLHTLAYLDKSITSKDTKTTYINAILPEDPFSQQGIDWLLMARETIKCLEASGDLKGYSVYIDGFVAITYDAVENVYQAFPRMIIITLVVVFVLMGLFFRSLITPFRSAATIALTASFVFGLAVLAFQKGDVDWVGIPGIHKTGEISFIAPAMSFSIIVGLGLDYDVFLISRILEFRRGGGHTHESSITEGLAATGGIITAAGLIMAVAFGSLLFSSTPALVQWSFILTVAVLVDTFVIRTMVVPILMGYTGKYSWWPQKMPDENRSEEIEDGENTEPLLEGEN